MQTSTQPTTASIAGSVRGRPHLLGRHRILIPLLLLLLLLPLLAPLASPGYFLEGHDAHHSVFFLVQFDQAVQDGALWPRWGTDHALGFGYPLWLLYAPLSYFIAEIFHLMGAGFTASVKLTWALATIVAALSMYALSKRWFGALGGLVSGLVYAYVPYRIVDMYVRAALAEYVALSLIPLLLLAISTMIDNGGRKRLAALGLTIAALLLTHTVTSLLAIPMAAAFALVSLWLKWREDRSTAAYRLGAIALAAALGVGLACIFLLPMLLERGYIVQEQWVQDTYQYQQHFVYVHQFLSPFWGYEFAVPGPADGMSFQIGLIPAVLGLLGALAWIRSRRRSSVLAWLFSALAFISLWLMTSSAISVWRLIPLIELVQFPWRLLTITSFALSILSGAVVLLAAAPAAKQSATPAAEERSTDIIVYTIVLLLVILSSVSFLQPQLSPVTQRDESPLAVIDFELKHPDMRGMTAWSTRKPESADSPLTEQYLTGQPLTKAQILRGEGSVETLRHGGASEDIRVQSDAGVTVQFFTYWFPGWQVLVDGQLVESRPEGPNGLITFEVPAGQHEVHLRMTDNTLARRIGAALSGVSVVMLAGLLLWPRRR